MKTDTPHHLASRLASVGASLPGRRLSTAAIAAATPAGSRLPLQRATGIAERRVCTPPEDSFWLATRAARDCLARSHYEAADLELLIYCGITKFSGGADCFQLEPSMALRVAESIGAHRARTFDLSNACAGMLTALAVLDRFIRDGSVRRGMIVSGECISHLGFNAQSRVTDLRHPELASLTLGDAGAAAIVDARPAGPGTIRAIELFTLAAYSDLCVAGPCPDAPGGVMHTDNQAIHRCAIEAAPSAVRSALVRAGLRAADLKCVIPHQTTVPAIRAGHAHIAQRLGQETPDVVENLHAHGNTASTTHFLALRQRLESGYLRAGDRVMLLASASGLVVGAVVLEISVALEGKHHGRTH